MRFTGLSQTSLKESEIQVDSQNKGTVKVKGNGVWTIDPETSWVYPWTRQIIVLSDVPVSRNWYKTVSELS